MRYVAAATVVLAAIGMGCQQKKEPVEVTEQSLPRLTPTDRLASSAEQPEDEPAMPTLREAEPETTATPTEAPKPEPITHVIRKDDTLWSLAVRYLGDGHRWREIMDANADIVTDPHKLPIGGKLIIPAK